MSKINTGTSTHQVESMEFSYQIPGKCLPINVYTITTKEGYTSKYAPALDTKNSPLERARRNQRQLYAGL